MSKGGSGTDFMSLLATFASATDQSTKSTKKIKVVSRGQIEVVGTKSSKVNARPGGNLCGNPPKKIKVASRGQTKVVGTASSKVNALPGGNPSDYYGPNRSTNTSTLKVVSRGTIDIDIDITPRRPSLALLVLAEIRARPGRLTSAWREWVTATGEACWRCTNTREVCSTT